MATRRGALRLRDVVAPELRVLFCGINPGLYSATVGHHFARPGNRFWQALHASGFTEHLFVPSEDRLLLALGYGLTNIVARASAGANELNDEELIAGRLVLERKVRRLAPRWIAILGIGAYRIAFANPRATWGPQPNPLGPARVWVLPNPSGLNASHQPPDLARAFRLLRRAVIGSATSAGNSWMAAGGTDGGEPAPPADALEPRGPGTGTARRRGK